MLKLKSLRQRVKPYFLTLFIIFFLTGLWFERERGRVLSFSLGQEGAASSHDCAVVLTGGGGRLRSGLDTLTQSQVRHLIISGVNMQSRLQDLFPQSFEKPEFPKDRIILERRSQTTYGNAHQTVPLLEALGCRSFLLITSQLHMYRASKTFQAALLNSEVKMTPFATETPGPERDFWGIFSEVSKSLFYSLWAY